MPGFDSTRDALSQGIVAAILVGVFALLAADRVHRVLIPIGAVALVWLISYFSPFRLISFEAAQQAVDLNVILLLFAMMALVGVLKTTNVFPWAVDRLLERSRGNPSRAARLIIWFTGILSAILDNVTTVIFTYPMASEMARRLRINGSAFFLPMVMAANIGGTATLIGDPPNVLIGADPRTGLSFMAFIYNLTVPCTFMMIVLVWYSRRYYPDDIGRGADADHAGAARPTGAVLQNVPLLRATGWITVLIFLGFMTHTLTHMPVAVPAVIGVAAILFAQDYYYLKEHQPTAEERQHGVLAILEKDIEWPTLAFFLFLFVLVGAAVATGLIESLAQGLAWLIGRSPVGSVYRPRRPPAGRPDHSLGLGLLSALIDNIPYTAVTIPLVASLLGQLNAGADGQILWWALALGACLGGNGTLIGASANVTVTGLAEKDGKRISFNEFTAFGARVAALTLADVIGLSRALALCRLGGGEPRRRRAAGRAVRGDAAQARCLKIIASPHQPSSFILLRFGQHGRNAAFGADDHRSTDRAGNLVLFLFEAELRHVVVNVVVGPGTGRFTHRELLLRVGRSFFGREEFLRAEVLRPFERRHDGVGEDAGNVGHTVGGLGRSPRLRAFLGWKQVAGLRLGDCGRRRQGQRDGNTGQSRAEGCKKPIAHGTLLILVHYSTYFSLLLFGFFRRLPYISSSAYSTHLNSSSCAFFST